MVKEGNKSVHHSREMGQVVAKAHKMAPSICKVSKGVIRRMLKAERSKRAASKKLIVSIDLTEECTTDETIKNRCLTPQMK